MDRNTYSENINSTLPKKYYEEARNHMVGIGKNIYMEHGDSILQLFSPLEKQIIRRTTWDPETGEPLLASKSTACNILEETLEDCIIDDIPEENIQKILFVHVSINPPQLHPILNNKLEKKPTTQNPLAFD